MVTVINLSRLFSGIKSGLIDLGALIDPRNIELFFTDMRLQDARMVPLVLWGLVTLFLFMIVPDVIPREEQVTLLGGTTLGMSEVVLNILLILVTVVTLWLGNYITDLLMVSGYFTYIGYFMSAVYSGKVDDLTASKIGFLYFFTGLTLILIMSYIVMRSGGREVKSEEGFPLIVYCGAPALLTGIFVMSNLTFVVNYLVVAYSVYLFYSAVKVRFGFDRSISIVLLTVFLGGGATMLVYLSMTSLLGIPGWAW